MINGQKMKRPLPHPWCGCVLKSTKHYWRQALVEHKWFLLSCFLYQYSGINPCHILVFPDHSPTSRTYARCNLQVTYVYTVKVKPSVNTEPGQIWRVHTADTDKTKLYVLWSWRCEHNWRQNKTVLSCLFRRCKQAINCKLEIGLRRDKTRRNWVETR